MRMSMKKTNLNATSIKAYTAEELDSEANVTYETATFIAARSFKPKDFISSKTLKTKNQGKLIFSLADGTLTLASCSNITDFQGENKKGLSHSRDIVKEIEVLNVTSNLDKMIVIQCETVPKFMKEGFFANSQFVNKVLMPGTLSATQPKDFLLLKRTVRNGTIEFQNRFPNMTPDTFESDISRTKTHHLIPLNNPVIMSYNSHPETTVPITQATKGFEEENQVKLKSDVAEKMIEITKQNMKNRISYGDVTNNFSITLSVPMPPNRSEKHKDFQAGKKEGIEFKGFADSLYALPHVDLAAKNSDGMSHHDAYMNTPFFFNAEIKVTYLRCNGKTIPLKI